MWCSMTQLKQSQTFKKILAHNNVYNGYKSWVWPGRHGFSSLTLFWFNATIFTFNIWRLVRCRKELASVDKQKCQICSWTVRQSARMLAAASTSWNADHNTWCRFNLDKRFNVLANMLCVFLKKCFTMFQCLEGQCGRNFDHNSGPFSPPGAPAKTKDMDLFWLWFIFLLSLCNSADVVLWRWENVSVRAVESQTAQENEIFTICLHLGPVPWRHSH